MRFAPRSSNGRATACRRIRGRGSCRPGASRPSTASAGAPGSTRSTMSPKRSKPSPTTTPAPWDAESHRGRSAAPHLHVLPSGARAGGAGGAHPARGLRPRDRGNRAGIPAPRAHAGAAHRPREGKNPRRPHPLPGAGPGRIARAPRERAARGLSRVQRRLLGVVRPIADAGRPVRRGDPPGTAPRRTLLPEPEAQGLLALDAAAGIAPGRARLARAARSSCSPIRIARSGTATRSPKAWRSWNGRSRRDGSAPTRCRRRSPPSMPRQRAPTPPTGARSSGSTMSCCAIEPSPVVELNRAVAVAMRDGPAAGLELVDAILARGELAGLPPGPCRPGGLLPPAGPQRRRPGRLRARDRAGPAGAGAAVPRAKARPMLPA